MVAIKLTVVIAFIGIGAFYVHPADLQPTGAGRGSRPAARHAHGSGHQIWRAIGDVFTGNAHSKYGVGGVIHRRGA